MVCAWGEDPVSLPGTCSKKVKIMLRFAGSVCLCHTDSALNRFPPAPDHRSVRAAARRNHSSRKRKNTRSSKGEIRIPAMTISAAMRNTIPGSFSGRCSPRIPVRYPRYHRRIAKIPMQVIRTIAISNCQVTIPHNAINAIMTLRRRMYFSEVHFLL